MPYTIEGNWYDNEADDTDGVPFVNVNKSFVDTDIPPIPWLYSVDGAYTSYYIWRVMGIEDVEGEITSMGRAA